MKLRAVHVSYIQKFRLHSQEVQHNLTTNNCPRKHNIFPMTKVRHKNQMEKNNSYDHEKQEISAHINHEYM